MRKQGWLGFTSGLLATLCAFTCLAVIRELPNQTTYGAENLNWDWAEGEPDCQQYLQCVFIEVDDTQLCDEQIEIDAIITDEHDDWVASAAMLIESSRKTDRALVEVGVNREDFEYFMVGRVNCNVGLPTVEALL